MSTPTTADLVAWLCQYHLVEPEHLPMIADLAKKQTEAKALAKELLQRGWLSAFQANHLLKGKAADLVLGSYVLVDRLGEGGMGAVYKARHAKMGRTVAVKVIRKERIGKGDAARRFQREIRAAAQLNHPNIVRAYDADDVEGTQLLVMELVEGAADLAKLVKEDGPLPIADACDYIRQAALGLQHAHERGMVHRDIKPQNLLIAFSIGEKRSADGKTRPDAQSPSGATVTIAADTRLNGVVKILDMGLARLGHTNDESESHSTLTQEGTVMGTLDYIAPEQARDSHSVDIRADLYSLGCTLFFLLTGRVPFPGGTAAQKLMKHQLDTPPAVQSLRPDVPAGLADIAAKLMAKRADDRFQTPGELALALANPAAIKGTASARPARVAAAATTSNVFAELLAGDTVEAQTTDHSEPAAQPSRPLPWIWLGAGAGALVVAILVVVLLSGGGGDNKTPNQDGQAKNLDGKKPLNQDGKVKYPDGIKPPEPGWTSWFADGDLADWEGLKPNWRVEPNQLIGSSKPDGLKFNTFLVSTKKYQDFEVKMQVRLLGPGANSGLQIRSDYVDRAKYILKGPQCDMGGVYWGSLYGELFGGMMQQGPKDISKRVKTDDFNDYTIKCVGDHVTIKLNGETTVDGDFPTMPKEGYLGWQIHSGGPMEVTFRNVQFRELNSSPLEAGFIYLFDGKDLTGWMQPNGQPPHWQVDKGELIATAPVSLVTKEKFGPDFDLHAEFWIPLYANVKGQGRGNSGIFLQGRYEIQILDNFEQGPPGNTTCAALYGQITPSKNASKPPEQWQTYDIRCRAPRVDGGNKVVTPGRLTVVHNDIKVIDDAPFMKTCVQALDERMSEPGPIMLQWHGQAVRFRNSRIRPIEPQ